MKGRKRMIAGVACGVLAALLMMVYMADVRAQALASREDAVQRYGGDTVEVCVATRNIPSGEMLRDSDVSMQLWVVDLLPDNVATSKGDVVGKTAQVTILANEPIAAAKVGDAISTLSVPEGLCAVSVPSQDVLAVGGAIKSGSLVNVYSTGSSGAVLIGENILVLETSNSGAGIDSGGSVFGNASGRASVAWVTLAVTPESVEQLITASKHDGLYFALPGASGPQEALEGDTGAEGGDRA